jgi:glycerophosphoryl diester phosphodiesterase
MLDRPFSTKFFPIVVAHRGASSTKPENTLEAFDEAFRTGARVVELDVRLTADGVAVVAHDPGLGRVTDGADEGLVHELTAEAIRRAAPGIPTLEEACALAAGRGGLDLEIKNVPWDPAFDPSGERVLEAALDVAARAFPGPLLLSSFNRRTLERSRVLAPGLPTGLLVLPDVPLADELEYAVEVGHAFVLPAVEALLAEGERFVRAAHMSGLRVGTWVVDDALTQETLFRWGVDAVASNDPAAAVAVLRTFQRNTG